MDGLKTIKQQGDERTGKPSADAGITTSSGKKKSTPHGKPAYITKDRGIFCRTCGGRCAFERLQ